MSMSRKIYIVMLLLIVLAVAILGLGIYSINSLTAATEKLVNTGFRLQTVSGLSNLALKRDSVLKEVIIATDEKEMARLITLLGENNTAFHNELAKYQDLIPPWVGAEARERPGKVKAAWEEYTAISSKAADTSLENTITKAKRLYALAYQEYGAWLTELGNNAAAQRQKDDYEASSQMTAIQSSVYEVFCDMTAFIEEEQESGMDRLDKKINEAFMRMREAADGLTESPGMSSQIADYSKKIDALAKLYTDEIKPLAYRNSNIEAFNMYMGDGQKAFTVVTGMTEGIVKNAVNVQAELQKDAQVLTAKVIWAMWGISIGGILILGIIGYVIIANITKTLGGIIIGLRDGAVHVQSASAQISGASQNLAEGATSQAASLEETSSALEQMASMTRQNADNANKTNDTTRNNAKHIEEGAVAIKNMSQAMAGINDSAEKIRHIIKTIEEVAFQTNLLALNAAVEAARAGEAGKGFAVVADEVRNLAQRSAQAAKDTTELIHDTVERVGTGSKVAEALDASFSQIEGGSQSVSRLISEITNATNEQAQGVDQVNTAVAQMDKVTQENAANAEETASAAAELSDEAENLNAMVARLVSMVDGKGSRKTPPSSPPSVKPSNSVGSSKPSHAKHDNNVGGGIVSGTPKMLSGGGTANVMRPSEIIPLNETDDF